MFSPLEKWQKPSHAAFSGGADGGSARKFGGDGGAGAMAIGNGGAVGDAAAEGICIDRSIASSTHQNALDWRDGALDGAAAHHVGDDAEAAAQLGDVSNSREKNSLRPPPPAGRRFGARRPLRPL